MFTPNKLFKKKCTVKVPQNIKILYCDKKNIITFLGTASQTRSLTLKVKVLLIPLSNLIVVTDTPIAGASATDIKNVKKVQGTVVAKIKQILIEMSYTLYYRLNLVGVGYRAFSYEHVQNQLYFKLGYSHLIYFRIPTLLETHIQKFTKLFLYGSSSYESLTQTASQIRVCKRPEPYKGKGILYDQEKIILKKGKKI